MAEPSTATEMVRVPILGENGRISDDYIPEAIPQSVTVVEQAAQAAASSANESAQSAAAAAKSASTAASSVEQAKTYANNASTYMTTAEGHADDAAEAERNAQSYASNASTSATAAADSAETATNAATSATSSAAQAAASAQQVADKFITGAQATTLTSDQQATATVVDQVLQLGIPKGEKGDQGDPGVKGDPGVGVPDGGSTGDFVQKTADGTGWFNSEGLLRASYIGTLQQLGDQGQSEEIHDVSVTSNGYVAGISVEDPSADGACVYADDTNAAHLGHNHVGVDEDGPYVDIVGADAADGRYRYVDTISEADAYEIPTAASVKKYVEAHAPSNVLVGTATGNVAHAEDAYAAKPREVRIKGRTVKNLWPAINGSSNGVTVSTDETGLITVSGTATADATITAEAAYAPSSAYVMASTYGSPSTWHIVNGETQVTSGTQLAAPSATCGVVVKSGTAINTSFHIMLVEGSEAPDCFTPTGVHGAEPEKLMVAGKNLNNVAQQIDGVGWSTSNDVGWAETAASFLDLFNSLPYGDYTLRLKCRIDSVAPESMGDPSAQNTAGFIVRSSSNINNPITMYKPVGVTNVGQTIEIVQSVEISAKNSAGYCDQIYVYSPGAASGYRSISTFFDIQLELGSTATAYEPPTVTEVTLPETDALMDGDVLTIAQDGAVSVARSDGTTDQLGTVQTPQLPAPTFNVYPTGGYVPGETAVDYERDISITINNMQEVIDSLVGGGK